VSFTFLVCRVTGLGFPAGLSLGTVSICFIFYPSLCFFPKTCRSFILEGTAELGRHSCGGELKEAGEFDVNLAVSISVYPVENSPDNFVSEPCIISISELTDFVPNRRCVLFVMA
jgi:hypothetical protein